MYALTQAPLTRHQRWIAATLTAPGTVLSHVSAAARHGFRPWEARYEVVTRPGSGGPRQYPRLLVCRSTTLDGHTTTKDGIPITTVARTLVDLAPHLHTKAIGWALREALRLSMTTPDLVLIAAVQNRRGTATLTELTKRYAHLPYARTKSNAEARALERLHDAGGAQPLVNVRRGGEEADLVFEETKEIVEIDGPRFHRFPDEDARKERAWEDAGYRVRRVPSDAVYRD